MLNTHLLEVFYKQICNKYHKKDNKDLYKHYKLQKLEVDMAVGLFLIGQRDDARIINQYHLIRYTKSQYLHRLNCFNSLKASQKIS